MRELCGNAGKTTNDTTVCKPFHLVQDARQTYNFGVLEELPAMRQICLAVIVSVCVCAARADSVPTYSLTQGTVTLSNINIGGVESVCSFFNGIRQNIGGGAEGLSGI